MEGRTGPGTAEPRESSCRCRALVEGRRRLRQDWWFQRFAWHWRECFVGRRCLPRAVPLLATGGRAGSADAGAAFDAGMAPHDVYVACTVNIVPWSSSSLLNLPSGATATLAVEGMIAWGSSAPTQPTWQWTVKGPDGTPLALTSIPTTDKTTAIVQFPLLVPGSYDISVSATPACKGHASATAVKPQDVSPQPFFIRILPPPAASAGSGQTCDNGTDRWCPSQDAVPYEDTNFVLQPGQPRQGDVQLLRGYVVSIDPVQVAQPDPTAFPAVAIPSYVRISPQGSTWTFDGASTSDQPLRALLDPLHTYDVLVVPQTDISTNLLPPFLVASKLAQEFRPADFDVAQGVTLRGTLRGPGGPAAGARVLLRVDASGSVTLPLPSTVGSADASGAYSLQASAGALFSAVVVPPSGTSLPQVTIADCIDLQNDRERSQPRSSRFHLEHHQHHHDDPAGFHQRQQHACGKHRRAPAIARRGFAEPRRVYCGRRRLDRRRLGQRAAGRHDRRERLDRVRQPSQGRLRPDSHAAERPGRGCPHQQKHRFERSRRPALRAP